MIKGIVDPIIQEPDVYAFIALSRGEASAEQQRRASDWLLVEGCRVFANTTIEVKEAGSTDLEHDMAFAEGRRHVGILMREMLLPQTLERAKAMTEALRGKREEPARPSTRERLKRGKP